MRALSISSFFVKYIAMWASFCLLAAFILPRVVVGIEYLTNVKDSPAILKISAKRRDL